MKVQKYPRIAKIIANLIKNNKAPEIHNEEEHEMYANECVHLVCCRNPKYKKIGKYIRLDQIIDFQVTYLGVKLIYCDTVPDSERHPKFRQSCLAA